MKQKRNYLAEVPEFLLLLFATALSYLLSGIRFIDRNLKKNGIAFLIFAILVSFAAVTLAYYLSRLLLWYAEMEQMEIQYALEHGHF